MNKPEPKQTTIRLNPTIHTLLKEKSQEIGMSMNAYTKNVLTSFFRNGMDRELKSKVNF
jgi:predicted HicB family RNase H-like nuclease